MSCAAKGPSGARCARDAHERGDHDGRTPVGVRVLWREGCGAIYPRVAARDLAPDVVARRQLCLEELALDFLRALADMGDITPAALDLPEVRRLRELLEPRDPEAGKRSDWECHGSTSGRCAVYEERYRLCPRCGAEASVVLVTTPIERATQEARRRVEDMLLGLTPNAHGSSLWDEIEIGGRRYPPATSSPAVSTTEGTYQVKTGALFALASGAALQLEDGTPVRLILPGPMDAARMALPFALLEAGAKVGYQLRTSDFPRRDGDTVSWALLRADDAAPPGSGSSSAVEDAAQEARSAYEVDQTPISPPVPRPCALLARGIMPCGHGVGELAAGSDPLKGGACAAQRGWDERADKELTKLRAEVAELTRWWDELREMVATLKQDRATLQRTIDALSERLRLLELDGRPCGALVTTYGEGERYG